MKQFNTYQHLPGEPMTDRDKMEVNSKFWGKGKWDNFIAPLLPKRCEDMTLVDMGCNAGLFCSLAEEKGFNGVIGVDSDSDAILRGLDYKEKIGGKYILKSENIEKVDLPLSDYTLFVNSHYYLNIGDFIRILDNLRNRTRYCLIVSGDKKTYPHLASSRAEDIRNYFSDWTETEGIKEIDSNNDPSPRKLWTLVFRSPNLKRVSMEGLDCGNNVQSSFYEELDKYTPYQRTKYYSIIRPYRLSKNPESLSVWTEKQLDDFFKDKVKLYKSVKEDGLKNPIIVNKSGKILDGNHRFMIMKHLGHKTILVREV